MAPDSNDDAEIRAKILSTADRREHYCPNFTSVEGLADHAVGTSDEGDAKELIAEMASDDAEPLRWYHAGETVCLEVDSHRWTASRIAHHDESQLEWSHRQRLNGG